MRHALQTISVRMYLYLPIISQCVELRNKKMSLLSSCLYIYTYISYDTD